MKKEKKKEIIIRMKFDSPWYFYCIISQININLYNLYIRKDINIPFRIMIIKHGGKKNKK